ncbi:MAG TPA: cyclic nucleotide-binding domain-containing protein [Acidobacteriota bacterium]|nr:cyclic nucleotide-binding domain-containing protein [Acidobacteriota bacterium]
MFFRKKKAVADPQDLIARREYKKAATLLAERLSKNADDLAMRLTLCETLLLDKQIDPAFREYKKLAGEYTERGFLVKAIAVYKKMLKIRPGDRDIELLISNLSDRRTLEVEPQSESHPVRLEIETKLFKDLARDEFQQIVKRLALRHYDEDTIVVKEGDPGDSLFIIVRGEVRVLTKDANQKEVLLANLGEGEFFGEVALLTGKPRTATIITNTGSELLELTRADYESIINKHPHVKKVVEDFHMQRAYKTIEAMVQALRDTSR